MISLIKPSRLLHFFEEKFINSETNVVVYEYTGDDYSFPVNLITKNLVHDRNNFLFIDDVFEGLLTENDISAIESISGLENFLILSSNKKLNHPRCHFLNIHLYTDYYDFISVSEMKSFINTDIRSKKFICLNRQERLHRFKTVDYLIEKNLLQHGFVSCQSTIDFDNFPKKRYLDQDLRGFKLSKNLLNVLPLVIDLDPFILSHPKFSHNMPRLDIQHYDSYFNIVTERDFYNSSYRGFTEKVLKSILYCQPFIVVGLPGTLALLKEFGFKTFDRIIDETYDNIENNELRQEMVFAEINRLLSLDYQELHKIYHSVVDILEYNFKNYKELCNTDVLFKEISQLEFTNI